MPQTEDLTLDTITVRLTHFDKVLFPGEGITKGDIAHYYARVAPVMLPHLRGRPLTMHRFPRGIDHEGFLHKEAPDYFPDWIERVEIRLRNGEIQRQVVCEHAADMVYLANQNCITPHVWLSRRDSLENPDRMIFDLDPSEGASGLIPGTARELRRVLDLLGLPSFPMSTGSRGVHVIVPLDRSANFERARALATEVADMVAAGDPERLTTEQRIEKRGERLFLDISRNSYGQTGVAPYSIRALPGAPVAAPLEWKELEHGQFDPRRHTIHTIFHRLEQTGDPLADIDSHAVPLRTAEERLPALKSH